MRFFRVLFPEASCPAEGAYCHRLAFSEWGGFREYLGYNNLLLSIDFLFLKEDGEEGCGELYPKSFVFNFCDHAIVGEIIIQ